MPTPNFFAFRLRKDPLNYYQASTGIIHLVPPPANSSIPNPPYDLIGPKGWRSEGIKWDRHPVYRGILRSFSDSLIFISDGAAILQDVLLREGTEGKLQIEVLRRNNDTWLYEPYFIGDVDLSTAIPNHAIGDDYGVQCKLKEGGATALLLANDNVPYELNLTAGYGFYILFDGMPLKGKFAYIPIGDLTVDVGYDSDPNAMYIIPTSASTVEGDYKIGASAGETTMPITTLPAPGVFLDQTTFDNYFYDSYLDVVATLNMRFRFSYTSSSDNVFTTNIQIYMIRARGSDMKVIEAYKIYESPIAVPIGGTQLYDLEISRPAFTLLKDERIYLAFGGNLNQLGSIVITPNADDNFLYEFDLLIDFKLPETVAPYIRYGEAYSQLWANVCENAYPFRSDYLNTYSTISVDNKPYNAAVTCGDALRGIGTQDKPAKLSLTVKDVQSDSAHRWCMGAGIEGDTFRTEHLSYFYQDIEIAYLGEVSNFSFPFDAANLFNVLYHGMQDQNYDGLNGKDEPMTSHTRKLPFRYSPAELDWRSPFRYDPYGIEYTRANLQGKNTTDNKADKETFIVDITPNSVIRYRTVTIDGVKQNIAIEANTLNRPNNSGNTSGVLSPDGIFNLTLSPERDLKRMLPEIASRIFPRNEGSITFQTSDKNQDLISDLGSGIVVEKEDTPLPLSTPLLYKPVLFQFTAIVPSDLHEKMAINPYGYLRFTFNGVDYKGHINKAAQADAERLTFDFELIAHKDTDLSTLPKFI